MRNKHSVNIIFSFLPGIISIFVTFFSIPIYLNYFDNDTYANYLIQHFILTLGMILSLQLGKIASINIQTVGKRERENLIYTTLILSIILGSILSGICLFFINFFLESKNFISVGFSLFIGIVLTIIYINLEYISRGLSYFKETSLSNLSFYSLSISLPGFLIFTDIDKNFIVINLFNISLAIKVISILFLLILLIKKKVLINAQINLKLTHKFYFHSKWMTLTSFYTQIYDYFDKHLIKIYFGSLLLITYSIPQQIAAKLTIISSAIISVILPKLSAAKNDKNKKKTLTANLYLFIYLSSFLILIFLPFYENILNWWLKDGYQIEILKLFKLFLLATFLGSCSNILVSMYEANSIAKKNTILETYSIFPFLIGLFVSIHYENIYFFVIVIILKEFILLSFRIFELRAFILNYKILFFQILFFSTIFFFIYIENFYFVYINIIILIIISLLNIPVNILKNEFSKK